MNKAALEDQKARLEAMIANSQYTDQDGVVLFSPQTAASLLVRINEMLADFT